MYYVEGILYSRSYEWLVSYISSILFCFGFIFYLSFFFFWCGGTCFVVGVVKRVWVWVWCFRSVYGEGRLRGCLCEYDVFGMLWDCFFMVI